MREELAALKGSSKRLAASDRRHNGPHSPSSSNSWTAERQSRKAAERRHARQADWRPPGRSMGHQGVTRKLIPNHPDERRRPKRCRCGSTQLSTHKTETRQMVDIVKIVVKRWNIVFEDVQCDKCGIVIPASRVGTPRNTSVGSKAAAFTWAAWCDAPCSHEALAAFMTHLLGIPIERTAAGNLVNVANDELEYPAHLLREKMDAKREPGEIDEGVRKMMDDDVGQDGDPNGMGCLRRGAALQPAGCGGAAADEGGECRTAREALPMRIGPRRRRGRRRGREVAGGDAAPVPYPILPGCLPAWGCSGADDDGRAPWPSTKRRRIRKGYIHAALDTRRVGVVAVPSRKLEVLLEEFPDRAGGATAADGLPNYKHCAVLQLDHAHEVRETEAAAAEGDPKAAALHEMFRAELAEVRKCADRPGGAFPDPSIRQKAGEHVSRIQGIADAYDNAGFKKLGSRLRSDAPYLVTCITYPGLSATTHRAEKLMRRIKQDTYRSNTLNSEEGRRRYGSGKSCRESWREMGIDPVDELESILGVEPSREWAQIRMEGERAVRHAESSSGSCRGAMPVSWKGRRRRRGGGGGGAAVKSTGRKSRHRTAGSPTRPGRQGAGGSGSGSAAAAARGTSAGPAVPQTGPGPPLRLMS